MQFRVLAVAVIAVMFALTQTLGSGLSVLGYANAFAASLDRQSAPAVLKASDNSDSSADNSDSSGADNSDANSDNSDSSSDNSDASSDDSGASSDNSDASSADNGDGSGASATTAAPPIDDDALKQPLTTASGTSNGSDSMIATPGERVAVRVFPWLPAGIQLTIRPVDASAVPAAPGKRAGDLTFAVEARDASGTQLTTLPAEVNLAVRYADSTVDGLNESSLKLSRLDPATNQWQDAPKQVRETDSNYVAASIMQLGTYTVSAP